MNVQGEYAMIETLIRTWNQAVENITYLCSDYASFMPIVCVGLLFIPFLVVNWL